MRRTPYIAVVVALGVFSLAASAQAATVQSIFQHSNRGTGINAEYVVETGTPDGILQVGEIIRGAFDIGTLNSGGSNLGGLTPNNQWTGVFSIRIRAINQTAAQAAAGTGDIWFEPDPGFAAWVASLDTDPNTAGQQAPNGAAPAAAAMIRMWENPNNAGTGFTVDYTTSYAGSPDANVGLNAVGQWFWDIGMNGAFAMASDVYTTAGEGWVSPNALLGFLPGTGVNPGTSIGTGNAAINRVPGSPEGNLLGLQANNLPGAPAGSFVNFLATTNIRGADASVQGSGNAGFHADSDATLTFIIVPLPAAAWPGVFLIGLLGLNRIRRKRQAS